MISKRDIYLIIAAIVLSINVIVGIHYYDVGKRKVALVATQDSLKVVIKEKEIIQKQRDSIGAELKIADAKTISTRSIYVDARDKTKIKGDSAFDATGKFIQILDPRITSQIKAANNHITSLESELATAKFALRIDTVFIAKDSQEINLHKSIEKLTSAPRLSHGFQVGVGYCRSAISGVPCIYAGYGYSVRF
jgi:hypothetical protein